MGYQIGFYLSMVSMQLLVAMPVYYFIKWLFKSISPNKIALAVSVLILIVAWVSGVRYARDVAFDYHMETKKQEIMQYSNPVKRQEVWTVYYEKFFSNPENIHSFHMSALKSGIPTALISIIFLYWVSDRNLKSRSKKEAVDDQT